MEEVKPRPLEFPSDMHGAALPSRRVMKMIAEYLERAISLDGMAANEQDPALKTVLSEQASAYRRMAQERANRFNLPFPSGQQVRSGT